MADQSEFTRKRRLSKGNCPTHGIGLVQIGVAYRNDIPAGDVVACPRKDCNFVMEVFPECKIFKVIRRE